MYCGNVLMGFRVCSVCVAAGARGASVGGGGGGGGGGTAGDLRTGAGSVKSVATMATIGVDNCKATFSSDYFYRELKLTKHKSTGMPSPVSCLSSSSTDRWLYPIILRPRFFFRRQLSFFLLLLSFFLDFPDILLFVFEVSILTSGVHVGHVGLMHIGVRRDPAQGMLTKFKDPLKLSAAHS